MLGGLLLVLGALGILAGICLLSIHVKVLVHYEENQFLVKGLLLLGKKVVWQKEYDFLSVSLNEIEKKRKGNEKPRLFSKWKQKVFALARAEICEILPVLLKDLQIEEYRLQGNVGENFLAAKSLACGLFSSISWSFYSMTESLFIWRKKPEINVSFYEIQENKTEWIFQCMIGDRLGKIISKGIRVILILIRKGVKNGAKKRNRSAHANGYL